MAKSKKKPAKAKAKSVAKKSASNGAAATRLARDAFVYDHVRTPRGRGKSDGALHECTTLELARQALVAIKERSKPQADRLEDLKDALALLSGLESGKPLRRDLDCLCRNLE